MNDRLIPVQDSFYKEYFDDIDKTKIFLLKEEYANSAWADEIDSNSTSYFDLPNDCWIVKATSISIGDWIDAYNSDNNAIVANMLLSAIDWDEGEKIRFYVKKGIVFQAKWSDFLQFWDDFVAVEDDCPIVVSESSRQQQALIFRPVGDVIKIG